MKKLTKLLKEKYDRAVSSIYGNKFIVVRGNPIDGYKFVGPFNSISTATERKGDGYVAELSKETGNERL